MNLTNSKLGCSQANCLQWGLYQEGHPSKVAPNTTIVQEGSLNHTDRNKLRVNLRKNTLRFFLEIGFVKLLKLSKTNSLNQVSFDQVIFSAKWNYLSSNRFNRSSEINFFAIRTRSSLNKRLFIIKSGIVSVLNETQNMYGGLSVNPALQGLKKITKAEVQFTDPRLTRSLKHFLLYFYTFFYLNFTFYDKCYDTLETCCFKFIF